MKLNYYDTLGAQSGDDAKSISSKYKKLVVKYHPDKNKSKEADVKMKAINEAYAVLGNETKRKEYDEYLGSGYEDQASFSDYSSYRSSYDHSDFGGRGPNDQNKQNIFKNIFRSFFRSDGDDSAGDYAYDHDDHQDMGDIPSINLTVTLSLRDWYVGANVPIKFNKFVECSTCEKISKSCRTCDGQGYVRSFMGNFRCSKCGGNGKEMTLKTCSLCSRRGYRVESTKYNINIPAFQLNKIVFQKYGNFSPVAQKYGSLVISINIEKDDIFIIEGLDIVATLVIGLDEFIYGTSVTFTYLNGKSIGVSIPPLHTESIVAKGKGINKHNHRGNLVLKLKVLNNSDVLKRGEARSLQFAKVFANNSFFQRKTS